MDRFSLMIQSIDSKLLLLNSYQVNFRTKTMEQILEILNSNGLHHCEFNCTKIAYNSHNLFISNGKNDNGDKRKLLNRNSYLLKTQQVHNESLNHNDVIGYAIDQNLEYCLNNLFKSYILKSQSYYLLNQYLSISNLETPTVFLNWGDKSFQITILNESKILVHTNIKYKSALDSLYFIANEIQKRGLNTIDQKIMLSGFINKDSEIYQILYTYFKEIIFLNFENQINNDSTILSSNQHYFYDLFSMTSCE